MSVQIRRNRGRMGVVLAVLALGLWGAPVSSPGELIAYEDFESYRPGQSLDRGRGGQGWSRSWQSRAAGVVEAQSLTYRRGEVAVDGGRHALRIGQDNHQSVVSRAFPRQSDTLYYSFLFMTPTAAGDTGYRHHFALWAHDARTMSVLHDNIAMAAHRFYARVGEHGGMAGGPETKNDETYFVVVKFSKDDSEMYNRVDVFVNPTTRREPARADAIMRQYTSERSVSDLGVRTAMMRDHDQYFIDELRVGTTWESVVPTRNAPAAAAPVGRKLDLETTWRFRPGDHPAWADPAYDDSGWETLPVPALWEDEGYPDLEGFAWYRLTLDLPDAWANQTAVLEFGGISKADETFFNGALVGRTGQFPPRFRGETFNPRRYLVPPERVRSGPNVIAVRVNDGEVGQRGGIWREGNVLRLAEVAEQFPMTIASDRRGHLFDRDDEKRLRITVENLSGRDRDIVLAYRLEDYDGVELDRGATRLDLARDAPATRRIHLDPALNETGIHYLHLALEQGGDTLAEHTTTLGLLPPYRADPPDDTAFGVAEQMHRWIDEDERAWVLELMNRAGIRWVRTGFLWETIEPEPGNFRWSRFDRQIEDADRFGVRVLPILTYGTAWASTAPDEVHASVLRGRYMPELESWRNYIRRAVERYGDATPWFEIWNEPNGTSFWLPYPDARDYARLLRAATEAAREAHPDAKTILGGLVARLWAEDPDRYESNFLETIYETHGGDGRYFDRIAYHPYPGVRERQNNRHIVETMELLLGEMKGVMERYGDADKGLWLTEFGAPTLPATIDERRQAEALVIMCVSALSVHPVEKLFWYQMINGGVDPNDREQNQGILRYDFTPKPAYFSYAAMIRQLEGAAFVEKRGLDNGSASAYVFDRDDAQVIVLWADEAPVEVSYPVSGPDVRLTNLMGKEQPVEAKDGRLTFALGPSPLYLEIMK